MTETKKKLQCKRCSYTWQSRLEDPEGPDGVKKCPRCLSWHWQSGISKKIGKNDRRLRK